VNASCQRAGTTRSNMPSSLGPNSAWMSASVSDGPCTHASALRNVAKQIPNVSAMVPSSRRSAGQLHRAKSTAVVFPPLSTRPTRSPAAGT